ncbi:MAG: amino acid ABC transporter permease [Candidatus Rokubacteria bacterium]|nr:amino acid ABC transporter permease [Candidatus Rokubacteria bacterium]
MPGNLAQLLEPRLFWEYRTALLAGVSVTVYVFALAAGVAVVLGFLACLLRLSPFRILRWLGTFYAELCRNTPEYVLLVWVHYVPPLLLTWLTGIKINFTPVVSAVAALGLASSGYFTETFRAGIQAIPRGHVEAARSLAMSGPLTLRRIILPQAVRRMLPEAMNQFISLFKATTLVSLISVADLMYQVSIITAEEMRPMPLYSGTAFIYFAAIFGMSTSVRRFTEAWRQRGWA